MSSRRSAGKPGSIFTFLLARGEKSPPDETRGLRYLVAAHYDDDDKRRVLGSCRRQHSGHKWQWVGHVIMPEQRSQVVTAHSREAVAGEMHRLYERVWLEHRIETGEAALVPLAEGFELEGWPLALLTEARQALNSDLLRQHATALHRLVLGPSPSGRGVYCTAHFTTRATGDRVVSSLFSFEPKQGADQV
jgi:hypothetical protein